jgi:ribosomal protein S18 acetylase RimI-like enzyme
VPADAEACDGIIRSLPYHFGDPGGREQCALAVRSQAGLVAISGADVAGFLTWRPSLASACEITWMAVHATRRGEGVGTRLVHSLATRASEGGTRFLLVTTLSASVAEPGIDDGYTRTRGFYERRGFTALWEPEGWWDAGNQAVLMVRDLAGAL